MIDGERKGVRREYKGKRGRGKKEKEKKKRASEEKSGTMIMVITIGPRDKVGRYTQRYYSGSRRHILTIITD